MVTATYLAAGRIEPQAAHAEHNRALGTPPAHERAQACVQLSKRKRLDQVIVRATVEPGDAILDRVARGQHQNGRPDPPLAQHLASVEPGGIGQHHVEHDCVVVDCRRHRDRAGAVVRDIRSDPLPAQRAPDDVRHPDFVFHDEHAHAGSLAQCG